MDARGSVSFALLTFIGVVVCEVYHGTVKENAKVDDKVELDKPLYVRNMSKLVGEVCGYTIHKAFSDLPFRVVLLEPFSGGASIVVNGKLDFERQQRYVFQVAAHDCQDPVNMTHSERERVEIDVEDVNDHPPRWIDSSYSVSIGNLVKLKQQIVCLQITDDDVYKQFSDICRFSLFDPSESFYIDNKGCIYNKEVLVGLGEKVTHHLKVFAQDCGGLMTEGVDVHVEWMPVCTFSWKGYERNVEISDFKGNVTSLPLFKDVEFDICTENDTCEVSSLSVALKLSRTSDDACKMDSESLGTQREFCGLDEETTAVILQNETAFDGNSTFIEIPPHTLERLSGEFLISVWMRRNGSQRDAPPSHPHKEQIVCNSDDSNVIRRHYMWYLESCKMVFVLRKNAEDEREEKAESQWEWSVPELCDGQWHHYVVSSDGGDSMELYVDGRMFTTRRNGLKIFRKWKLHPLNHPPSSRAVIGACWMGRHRKMEELFHGWLAGLTIMNKCSDADQLIKCLSQCQERLILEKIDDIRSGTFVLLSEDKSHVVINSTSSSAIRDVLSEVDLVIPTPHPTLGLRTVSLSTTIICENSEVVSFDSNGISVKVSRLRPLKILTNRVVLVDKASLVEGVRILEEFQLEEVGDRTDVSPIETCFIRSDSSMDLSKEMFLFDDDILPVLDLQVDLTNRGLFVGRVGGSNATRSYEQFMKMLRYSYKNWSSWNQRSFVIGCLDSNEQLLTNHVKVSLQLVVSQPEPQQPDNLMRSNLELERQRINKPTLVSRKEDAANLGFWLPIFLVVCAGLIITLGILGMSKLKERRLEQHADMEWDNSEMSIAVNPLYEMDDLNSADRSEIFDDDDNGGDDEDDDDADEGNGEGASNEEARRDLEWDDLPY